MDLPTLTVVYICLPNSKKLQVNNIENQSPVLHDAHSLSDNKKKATLIRYAQISAFLYTKYPYNGGHKELQMATYLSSAQLITNIDVGYYKMKYLSFTFKSSAIRRLYIVES